MGVFGARNIITMCAFRTRSGLLRVTRIPTRRHSRIKTLPGEVIFSAVSHAKYEHSSNSLAAVVLLRVVSPYRMSRLPRTVIMLYTTVGLNMRRVCRVVVRGCCWCGGGWGGGEFTQSGLGVRGEFSAKLNYHVCTTLNLPNPRTRFIKYNR